MPGSSNGPSRLSSRLLEQAGDWDPTHEEQFAAAEATFDRIERALMIPIERIAPMKDNPRQNFRHLDELANSIADRGIMQPLVVRRDPDRPGYYTTVAGARRLMAANILRGHEDPHIRARVEIIPCTVSDEADDQALASALAENLARDDLTRAEAMETMLRLERQYGWSGNQIARRTGRNQSDVAVMLRVARDPELNSMVREELISPTAAGEITRLDSGVRAEAVEGVRSGTFKTVEDIRSLNPNHGRYRRVRLAPLLPDNGTLSDITNPRLQDGESPIGLQPEESVGTLAEAAVTAGHPQEQLDSQFATDGNGHGLEATGPTSVPDSKSRIMNDLRKTPLDRSEELRTVRAQSRALCRSIERHPVLAWDPQVAADRAVVDEMARHVSGKPRNDEVVSLEEVICWLRRLRQEIEEGLTGLGDRRSGPEIAAELTAIRQFLCT